MLTHLLFCILIHNPFNSNSIAIVDFSRVACIDIRVCSQLVQLKLDNVQLQHSKCLITIQKLPCLFHMMRMHKHCKHISSIKLMRFPCFLLFRWIKIWEKHITSIQQCAFPAFYFYSFRWIQISDSHTFQPLCFYWYFCLCAFECIIAYNKHSHFTTV